MASRSAAHMCNSSGPLRSACSPACSSTLARRPKSPRSRRSRPSIRKAAATSKFPFGTIRRRSRRTAWSPLARGWNSCRRRPTSVSAPPTSAASSFASSPPMASPVCATGFSESQTAPISPYRCALALVPRMATLAWTADLDGDGLPEWILESAKVRAVFSAQDGGRWMEFTWKDTNANFLPETGLFAQAGPVEVAQNGDALEFTGKGWKRTVKLDGTALTVEQSTALPAGDSGQRKARQYYAEDRTLRAGPRGLRPEIRRRPVQQGLACPGRGIQEGWTTFGLARPALRSPAFVLAA